MFGLLINSLSPSRSARIHRRRTNRALGKNISQKRSSRFENTRDIDASSSRETSSSNLSLLKAYLSLRVFWIQTHVRFALGKLSLRRFSRSERERSNLLASSLILFVVVLVTGTGASNRRGCRHRRARQRYHRSRALSKSRVRKGGSGVSAKQRERGETLRDGTALCCSKENRHSTKSEDDFLNFGGNLLE